MSLSDIFTPSVVISLAISLLLIGLLGLYVNNKMNEQNHKLNTMFDLVSTLANELQMVRSQPLGGMGSVSMGGGGSSGSGRVYEKPEVANTNHLVNMIDVSDDSDSGGDESDGETDEGAESGDDSGSDDDDNNEGDGEEDSGSDGDNEESDGDSDDGEHDARSDKAIIVSESLDDALFEELANLDDIVLGETNVERAKTPETTTTPANTSNVKNLNVVFDYKKASLGKLREIVEQKGLSNDTSKLKKQELLKMLEID
jgi:hypothetical protein